MKKAFPIVIVIRKTNDTVIAKWAIADPVEVEFTMLFINELKSYPSKCRLNFLSNNVNGICKKSIIRNAMIKAIAVLLTSDAIKYVKLTIPTINTNCNNTDCNKLTKVPFNPCMKNAVSPDTSIPTISNAPQTNIQATNLPKYMFVLDTPLRIKFFIVPLSYSEVTKVPTIIINNSWRLLNVVATAEDNESASRVDPK